jgi:hypothetical protein
LVDSEIELPTASVLFWISHFDLSYATSTPAILALRGHSFQSVAVTQSGQSLPELLGVMRL